MSDGFTEKLSENSRTQQPGNENEQGGFRNALFINPINYEPDIQIQEIEEGLENVNLFSDSFFSSGTPKSKDSLNFKHCLSSDLLRRIDEGSPHKSTKSQRKASINEFNEENEDDESKARESLSLFYTGNKKVEKNPSKYLLTVNMGSNEEEPKGYYNHFNFPGSTTVNKIRGDNENFLFSQNLPADAFSPSAFMNKSENPNIKVKEYSIPLQNHIGRPNNSNMNGINYMNYAPDSSPNNNITYEEFLRKKYNNCNPNNYQKKNDSEDFDYSSNSTLSTISKRLSPFDDGIAFYPKNFHGAGIPNLNSMSNLQGSNKSNSSQNHPSQNPSQNAYSSYYSNSNFTNFNNNLYMNNVSSDQNEEQSADYLKNPLSLNSNINKIKKNVNLTQLGNLVNANANYATKDKDESKNYLHGKTGWVCSICRNFNYEGKIELINLLVRVKCNRCGKPQMKNTSVIKNISSTALNNINKLLCSRENLNVNVDHNVNMNSVNNNCLINDPNVNINNNLYEFHTNPKNSETLSPPDYENEDSLDKETNTNKANSADSKKKKKPFVERVGDWVCIKCKNLNFSFRVVCNRCQLTKSESEKLFEQYMKNLVNYVKINELLQNQLLNAQSAPPQGTKTAPSLLRHGQSAINPITKRRSNCSYYPTNELSEENGYLYNGDYFADESLDYKERLGMNNSK